MPLTIRQLDNAARPSTGQTFLWDDALSGFGARLTPTVITFIVQYRFGGRTRRMSIGRYGTLTLVEARNTAKAILGDVARGDDPAADRQDARDRASADMTLAQLWDRYVQDGCPKSDGRPKRASTIQRDKPRFEKRIAPRLGRKLISRISDDDIVKLERAITTEGAPGQAGQCVAMMKSLLSYARRIGATDNLAGMAAKVRASKKVERYLSADEAQRLLAALDDIANRTPHRKPSVAAIIFLLGTGARVGEALTLRWSDIDLARRVARLRQDKTSDSGRTLILNDLALEALDLVRGISGEWCFPGRRENAPLTNIVKPFKSALAAAGIKDARLHDLRHSHASAMINAGVSLYVVGKALGHKRTETTTRYAHLQDETLRTASRAVVAFAKGKAR